MDDRLAGYLKTRRTIPAAQLGAPGPDAAALNAMLTIATRVPDHGKLAPWRFILYDAASRAAAVAGLPPEANARPLTFPRPAAKRSAPPGRLKRRVPPVW